ncbi:MAG: LysM peptidoglycan-binding domain-containing protein [Bacteroidetes bacterium]|nr:LysM peptidoglycan-binding domain-containing protein [Bacteroidota bacterium]
MKKIVLSIWMGCAVLTMYAQGTTHKIAKGETLYAIAKKYHVTVVALEKANGLTGESKLKLGQVLTIPGGAPAISKTAETKPAEKPKTPVAGKPASAAVKPGTEKPKTATTAEPDAKETGVHVVKKGESLYSLARVYGVTVKNLREANGLAEDAGVKIGQRLTIPSKNPEAAYKHADSKPAATEPNKSSTSTGHEYLSSHDMPVRDKPKAPEKKEEEIKIVESPTPVRVSDEKPTAPPVTDQPKEVVKKEAVKEEKMPPAKPAETVLNSDVAPADYATVYDGYATKGRRKVVYRGIGGFLKSENPGNQYLALYNYADMGSILKVTNLMSKQAIYVKVIGKVPQADVQSDIILKLSSEAAGQLKVNEDKFLVEVSSYILP